MSNRAGIWVASLAGSVLAHAGLLAGLAVALRPDPIVEQSMPKSELEVQAYQLDRTQAQEQRPDSAPTAPQNADGTSVAAGAIPQSSAAPLAIEANATLSETAPVSTHIQTGAASPAPVAASHPVQPRLGFVDPVAAGLRAVAADTGRVIVASLPVQTDTPTVQPTAAPVPISAAPSPQIALEVTNRPAVALSVAPIAATMAPTSVAKSATLAGVAPSTQTVARQAPTAPMVAPSNASGAIVPNATPVAQPVRSQDTSSEPVEISPTNAERLVAALAFTGSGDGEVDPVSLAAFQSFMQPGDLVVSGDTLRDGVSAILARVPCSRLQVGFDPETATLQVNGHIPQGDLRAPVLNALRAEMGDDITVSDNILILPRPQCGALSGIGAVGLAQSTDQITNPLLIGQDTHVRVLDFVKDERLFFDLTAPDYDAFVYVDYFDAGGNVLHLSPNAQSPLQKSKAQSVFRVGARQAGEDGLQIFIGPPYGQEIAVAFAASDPLYDGGRPLVEPAAAYLDWLKTRVADLRAENPQFKGEWVYFFITTAEQ